MSLRFVDGFDYYATADIGLKWSSLIDDGTGAFPTLAANTGRFGSGTQALKLGGTGEGGVNKILDSQSHYYIGWALFFPSGSTSLGSILRIFNSFTGQPQMSLSLNSGILVYANGARNNYQQNATVNPASGVWNYLEVKVSTPASSCAAHDIQVRLNGVTVIDIPAGTNTIGDYINNSTIINQITFGGNRGFSPGGVYIDDIYICDGNGSVNNTFLGDIRIEAIMPNGAGTTTQWTPLSGNNYANVNEVPEDGDTSYVSTNTVGNIDTYQMADLSSTPTAVYGIQANICARKDDAGIRTVASVVRSGGANYDHGSTNPLGLAGGYSANQDIWELDPNGGIPWTGTSINAMEAGIKLVS